MDETDIPSEEPAVFGRGRGRARDKLMFTKTKQQEAEKPPSPEILASSSSSTSTSDSPYTSYLNKTIMERSEPPAYSTSESEVGSEYYTPANSSDVTDTDEATLKSGDDDSTTFSEATSCLLTPVSEEQETEGSQLSRGELAHEFRMDAVLSTSPIPAFYRCCVCGCPAGSDTFSCKANGHPTCYLCTTELEISECPYIRKDSIGRIKVCESALYQYPSMFRTFIFDNTQISCIHFGRGCPTVGTWDVIKNHQDVCEFADK